MRKAIPTVIYNESQPSCECGYTSPRVANVKRHQKTMHRTRDDVDLTLTCCGIKHKDKYQYRTHCRDIHADGYQCPICKRCFGRKALLRRHNSVHTGIRDFHCPFCSYESSHKSNLERHLNTIHKITNSILHSPQLRSQRCSTTLTPPSLLPYPPPTTSNYYPTLRTIHHDIELNRGTIINHSINSILGVNNNNEKSSDDNGISSTTTTNNYKSEFPGYPGISIGGNDERCSSWVNSSFHQHVPHPTYVHVQQSPSSSAASISEEPQPSTSNSNTGIAPASYYFNSINQDSCLCPNYSTFSTTQNSTTTPTTMSNFSSPHYYGYYDKDEGLPTMQMQPQSSSLTSEYYNYCESPHNCPSSDKTQMNSLVCNYPSLVRLVGMDESNLQPIQVFNIKEDNNEFDCYQEIEVKMTYTELESKVKVSPVVTQTQIINLKQETKEFNTGTDADVDVMTYYVPKKLRVAKSRLFTNK